ncbi:Rrf2 family transcriptional regulator [Synechococcales cyanobacterium C]|uniref:Rrf2 family transcriptional regulator n=1 Tax=Petrachloros mirabilis ULC683 TaxID=2781853 RepID=A0A8K2A6A1_9CYAN|nr:Rrf2 family transcriptional regulator [Petrachloros mirabilis ULC683]
MELSCKSEYALLALMVLADHVPQGDPLQIRQIAEQQQIPDRYLEQLLSNLRRAGLIRSQRGAKGGYLLARQPWQITLLDVMTCIEGREAQSAQQGEHSLERLVVRELWQEVNQAASEVLQAHTLQDLCDRRDAQNNADLMYYI